MMRRKHQPLMQLPVMQTRSKKKNVQTKAVQNAIMECILKEVEAEKMKRIADGETSERKISYGLMDKAVKRHYGFRVHKWQWRPCPRSYYYGFVRNYCKMYHGLATVG
jgi:hypothetical protein